MAGLAATLAGALGLRVAVALSLPGYETDVNLFKSWAIHAFEGGLSNFYDGSIFADYPPGYIYVLYAVGGLRNLLSLEFASAGFTLLVKLPAIAADLALGAMLYRWAAQPPRGETQRGEPQRGESQRVETQRPLAPAAALALAALYLFNPAVIVNSAAWGQVDAVFMAIVLCAMALLVRGRLPQSTAVFALALLIKPQALLFGPLLLVAAVRRKSWKTFGACVLYGLPVFLLPAIPFVWRMPGGLLWLKELYFGTLSQYPYASLNAYNLHALLGGNWQSVNDTVLGITHTAWSIVGIGAGAAFSIYLYARSRSDDRLHVIGFLWMFVLFMATVKMHERYLFYAMPMALTAWLHTRDRRLLWLFGGVSLTLFANTYDVLANSGTGRFHIPPADALLMAVSLLNVVLLLAAAKVGWDLCGGNEKRGRGKRGKEKRGKEKRGREKRNGG